MYVESDNRRWPGSARRTAATSTGPLGCGSGLPSHSCHLVDADGDDAQEARALAHWTDDDDEETLADMRSAVWMLAKQQQAWFACGEPSPGTTGWGWADRTDLEFAEVATSG